MSVEVERKFICNADTLKTLEEIGAVCVGQRQFHDQYYDNPQFDLTLRDTWLRRRKGCWELKCPTAAGVNSKKDASEGERKAGELCTRYKEITDPREIQRRVKEVIAEVCEDGDAKTDTSDLNESWLREMKLVCFAEFTTVRQSFTIEEDGVHVDLDQADFGYHVGEVEVVLPEGGDVHAALEKIDNTARKLGLTGHQRVEGKMDVYLQRNNPEHYARLKSIHIL